jgi:hypothetical protein
VTAAEGEPAHAGAADDAGGRREAVGVGGRVHLAPRSAALDPRRAPVGIHLDAVHRRQVDHESALDGAESGAVVAAAAHRQRQVRPLGGLQGGRNVGGRGATRDHRRPLVDHRVVERAGVVIPDVVGQEHLAAHSATEFVGLDHQAHLARLLDLLQSAYLAARQPGSRTS